MAGKAKERKTFGNKLKDQQEQNKTLYSLASQGTITQSQGGSIVSGSGAGSSGGVFQVSETDLDMNTYDITNVDRLKFAAKSGASDALTANDYGIEAIFTNNAAYGLQIRIPEQSSDTFKIYRGTQEEMSISQAGIILFDHVTISSGNARKPKLVLAQYDSSSTPANSPSGTRTLFVDGTNSDNLSVKKSDGTVIDLESASGWVGTATSDLNMSDNDIDNVAELEFNNSATPTTTSMAISALSNSMYYNVPSNDSHYFQLGGTIKFEVNDVIDTRRNDVVNIKRAIFDEDDDTFIAGEHYSSIADDVLEIFTADGLRIKIENSLTTITNDLTVYGTVQLGLDDTEEVKFAGVLDSVYGMKVEGAAVIRSNDTTKINIHVSNSTVTGSHGSVGIPYVYGSSYPTDTECNTWFGTDSGNIAVFRHTSNTDRFYFNTADGWNYVNSDGTA